MWANKWGGSRQLKTLAGWLPPDCVCVLIPVVQNLPQATESTSHSTYLDFGVGREILIQLGLESLVPGQEWGV